MSSDDYKRVHGIIPIFEVTLASAFTNQPTNDGVEIVSSSASDTQKLTILYTDTGSSNLLYETVTLDGTTQVALTSTAVANVYGAFLGTIEGKMSSRAVGTITIREASANATITTIAAGKMSSGTQVFYLAGKNVEVENIAGNTFIKTISNVFTGTRSALAYTDLAVSTGEVLQLTGRMSKKLVVSGYLSIASDVTGSTVQIAVYE